MTSGVAFFISYLARLEEFPTSSRAQGQKIMKRILRFFCAPAMILGFQAQAHATLVDRGVDSLGNDLIYDTAYDITWYDYTNDWHSWQQQVDWANGLSVHLGGQDYSDWRLPTSLNHDGLGPCSGYNCTGSEMGHLYYTELGNTAVALFPHLGGLQNTGPFSNLVEAPYWTGTEYAPDTYYAWAFRTGDGWQTGNTWPKYCAGLFCQPSLLKAVAVMDGDVAPVSTVPVPPTILLLASGLVGLAAFGKKKSSKAKTRAAVSYQSASRLAGSFSPFNITVTRERNQLEASPG